LRLLKEYGKREDVLAANLLDRQNEQLDVQVKINEAQIRLDQKKKSS